MDLEFNKDDLLDINDLLAIEKSEGSVWVAYFLNEPIDMGHLAFFEQLFDAIEYCHEMSTDHDFYSCKPIIDIQKEIKRLIDNDNELTTQNFKKMKKENVEAVLRQVKFTGFGDALENELRTRMMDGEQQISASFKPDFKIPTEAVTNIQLSDKGNYFFNSYDFTVNKEGVDPLKQTIFINGGQKTTEGKWVNSDITLKEAANMMDLDETGQGRSVLKSYVNKQGEEYKAWTRFDFTEVDKYGNFPIIKKGDFDLEKKLAAYGYDNVSKEQLESLHKGNPTTLNTTINGIEVKQAVIVNADFKTISNYGSRQAETLNQNQGENLNNSQAQETNQNNRQSSRQSAAGEEASAADGDDPKGPRNRQGQRNGIRA